jgi:Arc/MetJ-type ribon-helix-helix transcriptional regulator/predicted RNA-binding Zn-ribbon protein involved in translation (DUF1610 family)
VAKSKKSKKPPSRQRYDEEHRVRSARLDKEYDERLDKLLKALGLSYSDFVKAHIRKDEAMIEKRVEILTSRLMDPSLEDRVGCLESLVLEIYNLTVDTVEYPPLCPRCEDQEMRRCEGTEMASSLASLIVPTWKCPKCGFFLNTYHRIDPKSLVCPDSEPRHVEQPTVSTKPRTKKTKRRGGDY